MRQHKQQPEPTEQVQAALERYEGRLVRYALRITGSLDQARDVVQDAFLKLCQANPFPANEKLAPWLFRVCRNRALDIRRKENPMQPLDETTIATARSGDPSASEILEQSETQSEILEALTQLPADQQEVIRLKFQEQLSYKEISSVTGLSIGNVGYLIHIGIKALREQFGGRMDTA